MPSHCSVVESSPLLQAARTERTEPVDFEIDTDLLSDAYNQVRRLLLPYGIVVNDKPSGILIPINQLEKVGWFVMPDEEDLTAVTFTEDVTGLLITEARLLVLCTGIRTRIHSLQIGCGRLGRYSCWTL